MWHKQYSEGWFCKQRLVMFLTSDPYPQMSNMLTGKLHMPDIRRDRHVGAGQPSVECWDLRRGDWIARIWFLINSRVRFLIWESWSFLRWWREKTLCGKDSCCNQCCWMCWMCVTGKSRSVSLSISSLGRSFGRWSCWMKACYWLGGQSQVQCCAWCSEAPTNSSRIRRQKDSLTEQLFVPSFWSYTHGKSHPHTHAYTHHEYIHVRIWFGSAKWVHVTLWLSIGVRRSPVLLNKHAQSIQLSWESQSMYCTGIQAIQIFTAKIEPRV